MGARKKESRASSSTSETSGKLQAVPAEGVDSGSLFGDGGGGWVEGCQTKKQSLGNGIHTLRSSANVILFLVLLQFHCDVFACSCRERLLAQRHAGVACQRTRLAVLCKSLLFPDHVYPVLYVVAGHRPQAPLRTESKAVPPPSR